MVVGVGAEPRAACVLADKYRDRRLADRVHGPRLDAQPGVAAPAQHQRSRGADLRAPGGPPAVQPPRRCAPTHRWCCATGADNRACGPMAISGDLPIVLVQISDIANLELAREAVQAHAYWRMKGLAADLVIWNEERAGYRQDLRDALMGMVAAERGSEPARPPRRHLRACRREQISHEDRLLLLAVARIVLDDRKGGLGEHLRRRPAAEALVPRLVPNEADRPRAARLCAGTPKLRSSSTTVMAATPPTRASTSSSAVPARRRRCPGPTSSPIRTSAASYRKPAPAIRWRENAHEYRLTPWQQRSGAATRPAKPSTCATRTAAATGRRRRCPRAGTSRTARGTASATACSSTRKTASAASCASTSRPTPR